MSKRRFQVEFPLNPLWLLRLNSEEPTDFAVCVWLECLAWHTSGAHIMILEYQMETGVRVTRMAFTDVWLKRLRSLYSWPMDHWWISLKCWIPPQKMTCLGTDLGMGQLVPKDGLVNAALVGAHIFSRPYCWWWSAQSHDSIRVRISIYLSIYLSIYIYICIYTIFFQISDRLN